MNVKSDPMLSRKPYVVFLEPASKDSVRQEFLTPGRSEIYEGDISIFVLLVGKYDGYDWSWKYIQSK